MKKPRTGMIQLSYALPMMSSKIHRRNRTRRGEISARSARRQLIREFYLIWS
jgi:hypothetical protein